jgi:hypothetical protein
MLMLTLLAFLAIVILSVCVVLCVRSPMLSKFFIQNFGEFRDDCRLLFNQQALNKSMAQWKSRVNVYAELKAQKPQPLPMAAAAAARATGSGMVAVMTAPDVAPAEIAQKAEATGTGATNSATGVARIDYLSSDRLRILDAKFSTLLQLHTLLGVMLTITTNKFWEQLRDIVGNWRGGLILFALPFALWFITIVGCLMAVGNIRWGDLWKAKSSDHGLTPEQAEANYVDTLVEVVVVRTAMLRMLSALALLNFVLSTLAVTYLVYQSLRQTPKPGPVIVSNILESRIYQFPPGQACADDMDGWIRDVSDSISRGASQTITLSTSADAMALKPSLRRKYGNNIGLAFARGTCVGDRIKKKLFPRGMQVETDVRVRDLSSRETPFAGDRTVTVTWLAGHSSAISR